MAFYIDFNFINIRDLIDLSEVDLEFENQMHDLAEQIFENVSESPANPAQDFEESAIKFLSEIVVENDAKSPAETAKKDVAEVLLKPVAPAVTIQKSPTPTAADKNDAYIKYINSKYEHSQAEYFINVLLNPVKTHLRNRFDYADVRSGYLSNKILGKDKDSIDRAEENRRRQDEKLRNAEDDRRIESLKKSELNVLFELKVREQFKRV